MNRATLFETPEDRKASPCPNCGIPNGLHNQGQAVECWRTELRHPEADGDDVLFLVAGGVAGILTSPPQLMPSAVHHLLEELQSAIEDRIRTDEVDAEILD